MRVTVLELAARWGAPGPALDEVEARLALGAPAELVLLPEASLCGYVSPEGDFDLAPFAEPIDGPTAQRCAAIARARHIHLVAPLVLREGASLYNAMTCFDPEGELRFVYRKRHPWIPETWATPGSTPPPVVELGGHRVTIATCYDLHFLEEDAAAELTAASLLLFPSAWVERPDLRASRLCLLAQRFGLHIANANWAPGAVHVDGQGGSCFISPAGVVIARAAGVGRLELELPEPEDASAG
jgi:predicted amidohydrolase